MAKKSFNISSTLSKNQGTKLAAKIPLKKKAKDVEAIEQKVAIIHNEKPKAAEKAEKATPAKAKAKPKTVAPKVKSEKLVRLTIDTPEAMHRKLKIRSIEKGLSMRDYILQLLAKEFS